MSWQSKKRSVVSKSTTEAEYRSLANLPTEVLWLQSLLVELKVPQLRVSVLWCDNQSTIYLSENPMLQAQTKNIEINIYFVREKIKNKQIHVRHMPSANQNANILTKALSSARFLLFRDKVRVEASPTLRLRGDVKGNTLLLRQS